MLFCLRFDAKTTPAVNKKRHPQLPADGAKPIKVQFSFLIAATTAHKHSYII